MRPAPASELRLQGVAVSLVSVPRFRSALERFGERLLERVFTPGELSRVRGRRDRAQGLAGRFAAKCAGRSLLRARHPGTLRLRDLEVVRVRDGEPGLVVSGLAAGAGGARLRLHLSLSHESDLALASVWLEAGPGPGGPGSRPEDPAAGPAQRRDAPAKTS